MRNTFLKFDARLRHLMEEHGIQSAPQLAKAMFDANLIKVSDVSPDSDLRNAARTINNHLQPSQSVNSVRSEWIIRYCEFFHCSADYLFGYISEPTHEIATVHDLTGLSEASVLKLGKIQKQNFCTGYSNVLSVFIEDDQFEELLKLLSYSFVYDEMQHKNYPKSIPVTAENLELLREVAQYNRNNEVEIDIERGEGEATESPLRIRLPKDTLLHGAITTLIEDRLRDYAKTYNVRYDSILSLKAKQAKLIENVFGQDLSKEQQEAAVKKIETMITGKKDESYSFILDTKHE